MINEEMYIHVPHGSLWMNEPSYARGVSAEGWKKVHAFIQDLLPLGEHINGGCTTALTDALDRVREELQRAQEREGSEKDEYGLSSAEAERLQALIARCDAINNARTMIEDHVPLRSPCWTSFTTISTTSTSTTAGSSVSGSRAGRREVAMMYSGPLGGHPELWRGVSTVPESNGPEADLEMWQEAESFLDHLCKLHESANNDAIVVALVDAYNRCIEERRRAEDLLKLHKVWESRRIGGVQEPESAVRGPANG